MSEQTVNYNLTKPDYSNSADIEVLNNNFNAIDTELKNINNKLGDAVKTDGTIQIGLNADKVDGKDAIDFVSAYSSFNQDTTDINTYNPNKTWTARVGRNNLNRPTPISDYSTVLNVGSNNNSNFQIAGAYDSSNKLGYRCRHDSDGAYGGWKRLLNEDDYNTLSNLANSAFQSASDGKSTIVNAITGKGESANGGMTFDQLASAIGNISTYKISTGTLSGTGTLELGWKPTLVSLFANGGSYLTATINKANSYENFTICNNDTKNSGWHFELNDTGFTYYLGSFASWYYIALQY